jgi:hypothetical protein
MKRSIYVVLEGVKKGEREIEAEVRETDGIGYLHGNDGRGNMGGHGEHGIARRDDGGSNHRDDPSGGLTVARRRLGGVIVTQKVLDNMPTGEGDLGDLGDMSVRARYRGGDGSRCRCGLGT